MTLTGKQRRYLRGLGHSLAAVAQVGKEGVSEALVAEVSDQLDSHELIKVRVGQGAPLGRKEVAQALAEQCEAEVAQVLGNTVLLYRAREEKPAIVLPEPAAQTA